MRGRISRCFAPHPNPLPINLPLSLITFVKLIVGKFTERGDFLGKEVVFGDVRFRMVALKRLSFVMEHPAVYRLWQAPFVRAKFAPILRHQDFSQVRRVLDVGCGPGTNAGLFRDVEYVGLDFNARYIEQARRRFPGQFIHADARTYSAPPESRFDFILVNSLLHHIDTDNVKRILKQLSQQLTPDGRIHILDLVLPGPACLARYLAQADRGDYPRPIGEWTDLFAEAFAPEVCEPYRVGWFGCTFWSMVYFKGKARQ